MPDWSMTGWKKGPVSLQQAFGIRRGNVKFPPLVASLPGQVSAATSGQTGRRSGGGNLSGFTSGGGTPEANSDLGQQMAAAYGWTGSEWTALNNIVMAESSWNQYADNPSSGAYGIPQSLPGSKMAAAGSDWKTNPATQIKWMLGYIRSRYGDPIRAWAFHVANGWY